MNTFILYIYVKDITININEKKFMRYNFNN